MSLLADLTDAELNRLADALADRLSERLAQRAHAGTREGRPLTAGELAERLGVSRRFVYEHSEELGAVRVGGGSKPRLRFPADATLCSSVEGSQAANANDDGQSGRRARRGPRRLPNGLPEPGSILQVRPAKREVTDGVT